MKACVGDYVRFPSTNMLARVEKISIDFINDEENEIYQTSKGSIFEYELTMDDVFLPSEVEIG